MKRLDIDRLLQIGIAMSQEKDHNRLLEIILTETMNISHCDAGTLYLCSGEHLYFKVMRNNTMGVFSNDEDQINLPPVPMNRKNVCACAAIDKKIINVADVRAGRNYDFSGPIQYDAITGYHTQSMLVVPMEDNYGEIIGVLQLINAQDAEGEIVAFDPEFEPVIASLASQAAVCATNMRYIENIKELFHSFTHVMSTAIDQRTPYNANHTRNMVLYAMRFLEYINAEHEAGRSEHYFSANRSDQFLMSVRLHDVGKLVIPLSIMDKDTRLSDKLEPLERRFDIIRLQNRIACCSGGLTPEEGKRRDREILEVLKFIRHINSSGYVSDDDIARIEEIATRRYPDLDDQEHPWLTPDEVHCLEVRRGTLTPEERKIMESHVEITEHLLEQIRFYPEYSDVPHWASDHHEFLNGTGYPKKLREKQIDFETRLLTIIDIYDALTAQDRPYRHSMDAKQALAILDSMAAEGKLDGDVVNLFRESRAWEEPPCSD